MKAKSASVQYRFGGKVTMQYGVILHDYFSTIFYTKEEIRYVINKYAFQVRIAKVLNTLPETERALDILKQSLNKVERTKRWKIEPFTIMRLG